MSDKKFAESVAFILGVGEELLGLFCPKCAADRMASSSAPAVSYLETCTSAGASRPCVSCHVFPLALPAEEALRPRALAEFMGRVLLMAEREAKRHPRSTR